MSAPVAAKNRRAVSLDDGGRRRVGESETVDLRDIRDRAVPGDPALAVVVLVLRIGLGVIFLVEDDKG
jgi:hypothetical protein